MKTLKEEVFDRINDRNPDLIAEVLDEIEAEENQRKNKKEVNPYVEFPLDTDCFGNCFSDADPGL